MRATLVLCRGDRFVKCSALSRGGKDTGASDLRSRSSAAGNGSHHRGGEALPAALSADYYYIRRKPQRTILGRPRTRPLVVVAITTTDRAKISRLFWNWVLDKLHTVQKLPRTSDDTPSKE